MAWRPDAHWALTTDATRQRIRAAAGTFIVRSVAFGVDHAARPGIVKSVVVQQDSVTGKTAWGLRSRWELDSGAELRVVLDRALPADPDPRSRQTTAAVKMIWNLERWRLCREKTEVIRQQLRPRS